MSNKNSFFSTSGFSYLNKRDILFLAVASHDADDFGLQFDIFFCFYKTLIFITDKNIQLKFHEN